MTTARPTLLFVTQTLPYPLTDGGNVRSFRILEALSREFHITLIGGSPARQNLQSSSHPIRQLCHRLICVPEPKGRSLPFYLRVMEHATLGKPLSIAYNYNEWIKEAILSSLSGTRFDFVHFNHADAAQYLPWLPGARYVIDTHNLLFDFHRKAGRQTRPVWSKAYHYLAASHLLHYERRVFQRCRRVLVCSREEEDRLRRLALGDRVAVVPNGVDCEYFRGDGVQYFRNPPTLLFTGNMGYQPNRDAAVFFIQDVLPLLRLRYPEIRFLVVGKQPSHDLFRLAAVHPNVTVTGEVEDVRIYFRQARVFVAPLRFGSGTRLKLLEAFAMAIPAVATRLGAEGIDCNEGEHILLADEPEGLAREVSRLLSDGALHARISRSSCNLARAQYDWTRIGQRLLEIYPG